MTRRPRSSEEEAALQWAADRIAQRAFGRNTTPICLFLGAGADISSGGLSFSSFKANALADFLQIPNFRVSASSSVDETFATLLEDDLYRQSRAATIEALFRRNAELKPSDAYKLIVLLGEAGGLDTVVTTNFDTLLEAAEKELGCSVFDVLIHGHSIQLPSGDVAPSSKRKIYLKLHGDLRAGVVTHLTQGELAEGEYDPHFLKLLEEIILTHDMIFAGYGGFDPALAAFMGERLATTNTNILWGNPQELSRQSPLYPHIHERLRYISVNFDELAEVISRRVLEHPRLTFRNPTFIQCLFEWRLDASNLTFIKEHGGTKLANERLATRVEVESQIVAFLASDQALAIVSGPSGFGKTTLGIQLVLRASRDPLRKVILLSSKSLHDPDVESHLWERLGGLGPSGYVSLAALENWLRQQGLQFVIFLDALNEYSSEIQDCTALMRNIVRLSYYLPERASAIRLIVTIREETWRQLLPRLDLGAFREAAWSASPVKGTIEPIALGPFTDSELKEALEKLSARSPSIRLESLPVGALRKLRDPFLLAALEDFGRPLALGGPTSTIYHEVYTSLLSKNGVGVNPATLREALAELALLNLERGSNRFRVVDVTPVALREEILRASLDLGIMTASPEGFLGFRHDRLEEYFLALGLTLPAAPGLTTLRQLSDFLSTYTHRAKVIAAARMYFTASRLERFAVIELGLATVPSAASSEINAPLVFGFAKEVLYEICEDDPSFGDKYLHTALRAAQAGDVDLPHLRVLIQSAAVLPDESALSTLILAATSPFDIAMVEAEVALVDRLLRFYVSRGCPEIDMVTALPFAAWLGQEDLPPWRSLGRVMRMISQAGADKLRQSEHVAVQRAIRPAWDAAIHRPWKDDDVDEFSRYLLRNLDRLVFNSTPEDISSFFGRVERERFEQALDVVESGGVLTASDLWTLEPYFQSTDYVDRPENIEFNLATLLFVLSGFNGIATTLQLWESRFAGLGEQSSPTEVDFLQGVLVYLHVVFGLTYDLKYADLEERILRDWREIRNFQPGRVRGALRGFSDEFDMIFEDGFGVIYPYGLLLPSIDQTPDGGISNLGSAPGDDEPLPLYARYLRLYLAEGDRDSAVVLLHALSSVIVEWPLQGLLTLRPALSHMDPTIHRAVVRVMAEAYSRHPSVTRRFLESSGSLLSDEDLQKVKVRQDPRIGRRQVSQLEWGRLCRFLVRGERELQIMLRALRRLLRAKDFPTALEGVLQALRLKT